MPSGRRVRTLDEFFINAWKILPKREISYFSLHCTIFVSTMLTFCSVFSVLKHYDAQTPGGIILHFALAASFAQGVLSHAVPHFMNTSAGTSSSGERQPLLSIGLKTSWTLGRVMLCLFPIFVMEIIQVWLITGKDIFSYGSPSAVEILIL